MGQPSNGQPDSYWITRTRRILRDQPVWQTDSLPADGTRGTTAAGSQPFRLSKAPVTKLTAPLQVTGPGGPYTVVYDTPPSGSNVEIVTETGELIFAAAPAVGTIAVTYQYSRFGDTQILEALTEGLDLLWPDIWSPFTDTVSILLNPVQLEYNLPSQFQDPRTVLQEVEFDPPGAYTNYRRLSGWRVVNDVVSPKVVFAKTPPAGAQCRLTYTTPYTALAATPENVSFLPLYYAMARLLADTETMARRDSDVPSLQGSSAAPPDSVLNVARHWMQMFQDAVARLGLEPAARMSVMDRAVERLGLSSFWRGAA